MLEHFSNGLKSDGDWDRTWTSVFDRYQQDIRHAYYIRAICQGEDRKILEIAAGSFRDVAALNTMGIECSGMDYSAEAVTRAREYFPQISGKLHRMDAFALDFPDGSFDMSYHNGFWGLFDDDDIVRLAKEQARVSRHRIVATVHNAHNMAFREYFERVSKHDPLYRIRFFEVEQITSIMRLVCRDVKVVPVGKAKQSHEDELINRGKTSPSFMKRYFERCGHRFLERSERLLCIGYI